MNKIYPWWRYSRDGEARIVRSAEEDGALVGEWADTPAAFDGAAEPEPAPKPAAAKAPRKRKAA